MSGRALLAELRQRGLRVAADGPNIRVRGRKSLLTSETVATVRERKSELIAALATEEEAEAFLDRLLDMGCTFQVIQEHEKDYLLWFGPEQSVATEVTAKVARLKLEIIALLRAGHPRSRRTWGEPTSEDWLSHPGMSPAEGSAG